MSKATLLAAGLAVLAIGPVQAQDFGQSNTPSDAVYAASTESVFRIKAVSGDENSGGVLFINQTLQMLEIADASGTTVFRVKPLTAVDLTRAKLPEFVTVRESSSAEPHYVRIQSGLVLTAVAASTEEL